MCEPESESKRLNIDYRLLEKEHVSENQPLCCIYTRLAAYLSEAPVYASDNFITIKDGKKNRFNKSPTHTPICLCRCVKPVRVV